MKAWTEMTPEEQRAAARKGDAVLLMPSLRTYRDVAHALTRAVVDCPLGYHDGRLLAPFGKANAEIVAWLQRLARISEAVEAIDAREAADASGPKSDADDGMARSELEQALALSLSVPPGLTLVHLARLAASVLHAYARYGTPPAARTVADADRLRRDIGDLRLALQDVPSGGASGDAPAWIIRLHRAACEVALWREDSSEVAPAPKTTPPPGSRQDVMPLGHHDGVTAVHLERRFGGNAATEPPETPHPHDATCSRCGTRLMFSARARGDGLCGPCHRKATGTHGFADRCREAGLEPSLVLEIMRSPDRVAALRAVLAGPPFDDIPNEALRPGDSWRDPAGTEYVVVPAADVGNRPRWLVGERTTPHHLSGLRTRDDLHMKTPVYHPYVLVEKPCATVEVDAAANAVPPGSVGIAIAAYLASPEGRAAIAECMRRPPVRMPDGTWREPTPGSEAKPGDVVRYPCGQGTGKEHEVYRVDGNEVWMYRGDGCAGYISAHSSQVEVLRPAAERAPTIRQPLARARQGTPTSAAAAPPLRIGDVWRDPEGTEYSVVAAADVGARLCWWLSAGTTATEVGLASRRCLVPGGLHSSLHARFPLALVLRETEDPR